MTYDVAIIGAGVTGAAIAYTLSNYTDVEDIALIEKCKQAACVQSSKDNNSQTLHFGDIETNYSLEKATKVKQAADYVKTYIEKHKDENLHTKFHKMVLAVGQEECERLRKRYREFQDLFPKIELLEREEIKDIEPNVVKERPEETEIVALFNEDGYAVDYGDLGKSFIQKSEDVTKFFDTRVEEIEKEKTYRIETNKETINAKVVVVAASASSLTFAQQLGYGENLILLPVMGDFFKAENLLNGKVYMMQDPDLPFAAIHGDPDVRNPKETRFGPISKVTPLLEKGNFKSIGDFLKLFNLKWKSLRSLLGLITQRKYAQYVAWNAIYQIPFFGRYPFLQEAKKIIPSIKAKQLKYGRGIGGVRPQVVNTDTGEVELGEAQIEGENILFNITPSPGASVCLANAHKDTQKIMTFFQNKAYNKNKFLEDHKWKNTT